MLKLFPLVLQKFTIAIKISIILPEKIDCTLLINVGERKQTFLHCVKDWAVNSRFFKIILWVKVAFGESNHCVVVIS